MSNAREAPAVCVAAPERLDVTAQPPERLLDLLKGIAKRFRDFVAPSRRQAEIIAESAEGRRFTGDRMSG